MPGLLPGVVSRATPHNQGGSAHDRDLRFSLRKSQTAPRSSEDDNPTTLLVPLTHRASAAYSRTLGLPGSGLFGRLQPPSTTRLTPVIQDAASEQRKSAALPMSSRSPTRPS